MEVPIRIDTRSSVRKLAADDLRSWASDTRVFVSSVMEEFQSVREAAVDAIVSVGATPVVFEDLGGVDATPAEAYLAGVASSHIYVGLLGANYGPILPSRYSATHEEYLEADRRGLRVSVWLENGAEWSGNQAAFVQEVQTFNVTGQFSDPDDLKSRLAERLSVIAAEETSPWCKIGGFVLRANQVDQSRNRVRITATVRDREVASEINEDAVREAPYVTTPLGVRKIEALEVSATARTTGATDLDIEMTTADVQKPFLYSFNNLTAEQITEHMVAVAVEGETPKGELEHFGDELSIPFQQLRHASIPEEAIRPVMRLFVEEAMVVQRGIARINRFRLGRPMGEQRSFEIEWTNSPGSFGSFGGQLKY